MVCCLQSMRERTLYRDSTLHPRCEEQIRGGNREVEKKEKERGKKKQKQSVPSRLPRHHA